MPTRSFETHSSVWNENAKRDARWAVLSEPSMIGKTWDDEGFFKSGVTDVDHFLNIAQLAGGSFDAEGEALDFGCGLGRLTQGLAKRFQHVTGIDVSEEMIRQAKELNRETNITFIANAKPDLQVISSDSKDLVLSLIVIQHIPPPFSTRYLEEFARVLKKGSTLVVQIPSRRKTNFKNILRQIIPEFAFRMKHKLLKSKQPYVTMFGIPKDHVQSLFANSGLRLLKAIPDSLAGNDWESYTYVAQKL